jgi:outer membrane protein assembly factor BamD (BamD/ComL family)
MSGFVARRRARVFALLASGAVLACAGGPSGPTLATLRAVEPDLADVEVTDSLDQAMVGYRQFLEEAPESALTPEAMRRLADLQIEKAYGILGDEGIREMPAPTATASPTGDARPQAKVARSGQGGESQQAFEQRATGEQPWLASDDGVALELPEGEAATGAGPLQAIALYDEILAAYPGYPYRDQVLYQKARAFDELGRVDEAIEVMERLIAEHPRSRHIDEVQFRRAEYFFTRKRYFEAEDAYAAVTGMGAGSEYYELALYKLGWTFYKQQLHEEALYQYITLLDYKVANGYDFDAPQDETDERRIADTFRVISLSFSSLGGPELVATFLTGTERSYEDRIYSQLGEFYLEKLRYHDAAKSYEAFVELHPLHRASPHFGMRVVEIYEAGGFPKLVLEAKKAFAARYGLHAEYWRHSDVAEAGDVLAYLKSNLEDLASHYHALYQEPELHEEADAHFAEASRWYRDYLASFPSDPESPAVNQRLADLLLEHEDFGDAALEYERTAYEYGEHEKAAEAGYAAIYAHREREKRARDAQRDAVREAAVASTLRFVDRFPGHEHADVVLGAAVEDLFDMKAFDRSIEVAQRLIDEYPQAEPSILRSAWSVVAHASFETQRYEPAEQAYGRVLEMTDPTDESRQGVVENLAAAIYKQGEEANSREDYRAAADHFLRIARAAPSSEIRASAEYDAGAALMRLEDWSGAAEVLDRFRNEHPDHELGRDATRQIALLHRKQGELSQAAAEYERVSAEAEEPELRREALLLAGSLYEDAGEADRAVASYVRYVEQFPTPIEPMVETRFKLAELHREQGRSQARREQLLEIVAIDAAAGAERPPRVRYLAARSALTLSEDHFRDFDAIALTQPFEQSLAQKRGQMDVTLEALDRLVDYEVGEVTAAATYYMAEVYFEFSAALMDSERPADLSPRDLQQYELVLEEEAFPFEERSIDVHEKNLELMRSGVYNDWIEKSLARLAEVMPGRYAKFEESSGLIDSLEHYAYRVPNAPDPEAEVGALALAAPATLAEPAESLAIDQAAESLAIDQAAEPLAIDEPAEPLATESSEPLAIEPAEVAEPTAVDGGAPIEPDAVEGASSQVPAAVAPAADPVEIDAAAEEVSHAIPE